MVVRMDITAKGEGDKRGDSDEQHAAETARGDRFNMLENLPSSIPSSRIYRKEDFLCSKLANGFYGDIFKVKLRREIRVF